MSTVMETEKELKAKYSEKDKKQKERIKELEDAISSCKPKEIVITIRKEYRIEL